MNTKYILEQIKVEGQLKELLVKSNGENVAVTYNGKETTLAAALAEIFTSLTSLPTDTGVDAKISAAIGELVAGAPEAGDTLKELFDLIGNNKDAMDLLETAIGGKVSHEELEEALEALSQSIAESLTEATAEKAGLMSAADKKRLDGVGGIWVGTQPPEDMRDGDLFVRVVSEATGEDGE